MESALFVYYIIFKQRFLYVFFFLNRVSLSSRNSQVICLPLPEFSMLGLSQSFIQNQQEVISPFKIKHTTVLELTLVRPASDLHAGRLREHASLGN